MILNFNHWIIKSPLELHSHKCNVLNFSVIFNLQPEILGILWTTWYYHTPHILTRVENDLLFVPLTSFLLNALQQYNTQWSKFDSCHWDNGPFLGIIY